MGEVIEFPNSHIVIEDKPDKKEVKCLVSSLLYCPNQFSGERFLVGMIAISIDEQEHAIIPLSNIEAVLSIHIATLTKTYIRDLEVAVAILNKGGLEAKIPNKDTTFVYGTPSVREGESAFLIAKNLLEKQAYFGKRRWDSSKP